MASPEYNLATEFPFVAEEWLYEKNDGVPSDYLPHSERETWWRCHYHPDVKWKSKICNRTSSRLSNCPICQKECGTSFPEQAIYYYLKLLFSDAENRIQIEGTETDIYLPSLKLAIECDGSFYHGGIEKQEKEAKKDQLLKEAGISVFHIKEALAGQEQPPGDYVLWCPVGSYKNYLFLENIMRLLVQRLNEQYGLSLVTRPDIQRDRAKILSAYMSRRKENSLQEKAPHLITEWHTNRNGQLTPAMVSYNSGKKVWWKCKKGHEWQAAVRNRYQGTGCPYCANKKVCLENSLLFHYPKIAQRMWNYEKNGSCTPSNVTVSSGKRVWWRCP